MFIAHPPTSARLLDLQVFLYRNHAGVCQLCCANIFLDLKSEPDLSPPQARTNPHLPGGLFVLGVLWYQSLFGALLYPQCPFNQNHVFPKPSLMLCKVALSCRASHNNNIKILISVSKCVVYHRPALTPHRDTVKWVLLLSPFTHGKTEAQRNSVTCPS